MKAIETRMKQIGMVMNQASGQTKAFGSNLFKIGLGLTFFMFGVQMQLTRMLRSMFNVFSEAQGQNSVLMEGFNQLRANLGTISIAFFDAFSNSGMMEFLTRNVEKLTNWFLNLSDETRQFYSEVVVGSTAAIAIIGVTGQLALGLNTIHDLIGKSTTKFGTFAALVGTALTVKLAMESIDDFVKDDILEGLIASVATAVSAYGTYGILAGKKGSGYFLVLAVGLDMIKNGTFFTNLLTIVGIIVATLYAGLKYVFLGLFPYLVSLAINKMIDMLNAVIEFQTGKKGVLDFMKADTSGGFDRMNNEFKVDWMDTFSGFREHGKSLDETMMDLIKSMDENTKAVEGDTGKVYRNPYTGEVSHTTMGSPMEA